MPTPKDIHLKVNFSTATPAAGTPSGSPGDLTAAQKRYSLGDHAHPLTTAESVGGKLYTAVVPDKYPLADVDAIFREEGGCNPALFDGWTQIATGVMRCNTAGHLLGAQTDEVSAFVGMRLLAWYGGLTDAERALSGPYVLTNVGLNPVTHAADYAQMQRAPDFATAAQAFSGRWVHVKSGGLTFGDMTFQLTTPDPIELGITPLTWSVADPAPTVAFTNELLTAAQISVASTDAVVALATVSVATGEVALVTCIERTADLGGVTLPGAGVWRGHLKLNLTNDDPTAHTRGRLYLRAGQSGDFTLVGETQDLHNTAPGMWTTVGTLVADKEMPIDGLLEAKFTAVSDSVDGVEVWLTYNDQLRSTYIQTPIAIGFAGTDEHDKLTKPSRWLPDQHPESAITPIDSPTVATVDGLLNVPSPFHTSIIVMGTEPLVGIRWRWDGVQRPTSRELTLFFLEVSTTDPGNPEREPYRTVINGGSPSDADYAAVVMGTMGLGEPPQNLDVNLYSVLKLGFWGGSWRPIAPWFICTNQ